MEELKFTPENLWLKDYYISRVEQNVRSVNEIEGYMNVKSHHNTSLNNNLGDESGLSPARFQPDLENEDPNEALRNPRNFASPQLQV